MSIRVSKKTVVVLVAAAFGLYLCLPFVIVALPPLTVLSWNETGDFLGGVSNYLVNIVTLVLLALVWKSEREDDREAVFINGLMTLIQLHAQERSAMQKESANNVFREIWASSIETIVSAKSHDERVACIRDLYEDNYHLLAYWYLSMYRLANYIRTSDQSDEIKVQAMKLFRLSCEREEQRLFFILLLMREESAQTPSTFFRYDFFKFANLQSDPQFALLWEQIPAPWKQTRNMKSSTSIDAMDSY